MDVLKRWMKEEYNNEHLLFYQPHMVQLVLMRYVNMHSLHRYSSINLAAGTFLYKL